MITNETGNPAFKNVLNAFSPIGLGEIDCVKLMDRVETKYIVSSAKINQFLESLAKEYRILESGEYRCFRYSTTYLDTVDYLFYNQHVRGELHRHKIRYRKYEFSGESFLEIKKKTNKGRTVKWRIPNTFLNDTFDKEANILLSAHSPVDARYLVPVLLSSYTRITLINTEFRERITIDYDISFNRLDNGHNTTLPYLAILELKKEGHAHSGHFIRRVRDINIHPSGFSKYCIGNALLNDSLKRNILKPKLLNLNRIKHEYNRFTFS